MLRLTTIHQTCSNLCEGFEPHSRGVSEVLWKVGVHVHVHEHEEGAPPYTQQGINERFSRLFLLRLQSKSHTLSVAARQQLQPRARRNEEFPV